MSAPGRRAAGPPREPAATTLDVVIPVYNEEADLAASVRRLRAHLAAAPVPVPGHHRRQRQHRRHRGRRPAGWRTPTPTSRVVHLAEKGRGRALQQVWTASDAAVLVYMDVDLSHRPQRAAAAGRAADLGPLRPRHRHPAAPRLARRPRTQAGGHLARLQPAAARHALRTRFSDAQCGFKAIRRDVARELLPLVEDDAWFFDTELLVLAERAGLRIHEVPVDWVDDPDSRVDIAATASTTSAGSPGSAAPADRPAPAGRRLRAAGPRVRRCRRRSAAACRWRCSRWSGSPRRWPTPALYLLLRGSTGAWTANLLALLLTAIGEHRGQPAAHLRRPRPPRRAAPPGAGAGDLRRRPGRHQRRAGPCSPRATSTTASRWPC